MRKYLRRLWAGIVFRWRSLGQFFHMLKVEEKSWFTLRYAARWYLWQSGIRGHVSDELHQVLYSFIDGRDDYELGRFLGETDVSVKNDCWDALQLMSVNNRVSPVFVPGYMAAIEHHMERRGDDAEAWERCPQCWARACRLVREFESTRLVFFGLRRESPDIDLTEAVMERIRSMEDESDKPTLH